MQCACPMNFRQLDLNLLRVLCAVYRSGSVTEAGRHLSLSQPATSNALARLRRFFDDALFVPSPSGLHPTRLAQRIAPVALAHLRALEASLTSGESFDPASGRAHWRLSMSDLGELLFLPPLAQMLRRESPASQVSNVSVDASQVSTALEAMDIDLAIGILNPAAHRHRQRVAVPRTLRGHHQQPLAARGRARRQEPEHAATRRRIVGRGLADRHLPRQRRADAGPAEDQRPGSGSRTPLRRTARAGDLHRPDGDRAPDVCRCRVATLRRARVGAAGARPGLRRAHGLAPELGQRPGAGLAARSRARTVLAW